MSIDLQTYDLRVTRVYAYLVIFARMYTLDIGVIQRTTSSSTGSRAWTDLNLEQRHDRFDRTVPLRGNIICRPSRPWASSASTSLARTLRKSPIFDTRVCIIAADAAFIIAGDPYVPLVTLPLPLHRPFRSTSFSFRFLRFLLTFFDSSTD